MDALFAPCRAWLEALRARSHLQNGRLLVDGDFLDCNWSNSYIVNGRCVFVDHEWAWHDKLSLTTLVIRNAYSLIEELEDLGDVAPVLRGKVRRPVTTRIARSLGVTTTARDFREFSKIQARIAEVVFGERYAKARLVIWLRLECPWPLLWLQGGKRKIRLLRRLLQRLVDRLSV